MRHLHPRLLTGLSAIVLALTVALPALATTTRSMAATLTFRPEPAESTAVHRARERAERLRGDSLDALVDAAAAQAVAQADTAIAAIGRVSGRITRFGDDVTIPREQTIDGDVSTMGGDVEVLGTVKGTVSSTRGDLTVGPDGRVDGDLVSFGGDIEIEGHVTGDVSSTGGDVTLRDGARVDGDVVTIGGTLTQEDGAHVGGQRVTAGGSATGSRHGSRHREHGGAGHVLGHLGFLVLMLLLTFVFTAIAPGRTQAAIERARQEPGMSAILAALMLMLIVPGIIAVALVMAVLCITIIGIPLALAVFFGYFVLLAVLLAWGAAVGFAIVGRALAMRTGRPAPTLAQAGVQGVVAVIGLVIVGDLVHLIPVLGFLGVIAKVVAWATFVAMGLFGAGAMIRSEYQRRSLQEWWRRFRAPKAPAAAPVMMSTADPVPSAAPSPAPSPSPTDPTDSGPIA